MTTAVKHTTEKCINRISYNFIRGHNRNTQHKKENTKHTHNSSDHQKLNDTEANLTLKGLLEGYSHLPTPHPQTNHLIQPHFLCVMYPRGH